jgi:hypothetical protein
MIRIVVVTSPEIRMTAILEAYREKVGEFEKARREVERVRKEAIDELLRQRKEINTQLRQLGYEGEWQDAPARGASVTLAAEPSDGRPEAPSFVASPAEITLANGHKRRRFKGARTFDAAYCSICQLHGHDLRAHRGQEHKRAFSTTELRARGLATEAT